MRTALISMWGDGAAAVVVVAAVAVLALSGMPEGAVAALARPCRVPSGVEASATKAGARLHVNGLARAGEVRVVDATDYVTISWERKHEESDAVQTEYWVSIVDARGTPVVCVQRNNDAPKHVLQPGTLKHGRYHATFRWRDARGQWSAPSTTTLRVSNPDWSKAQWIGDGRRYHTELSLSTVPTFATLYISGVGFYEMYINGKQVDTGAALNGAWTVWNDRVLFDTLDVTPYLQNGSNALAVMLGAGWRNTTSFPPQSATSACDKHARLLRAVLEADEQVVATTDASWIMSDSAPVLADSVYDGETYDARLEDDAWKSPGFKPSDAWAKATHLDCFSPTMTPRSFPPIAVKEERPPININEIKPCPSSKVGGRVAENNDLTLTCTSGSTISGIDFASFGTPNGTCGSFVKGTCHASTSKSVVEELCVGKASCTIVASDAVFGDPCHGTAKSLAVQASGCSSNPHYVVDFGENLSGLTRIRVKGNKGVTVVLRHAEVLQHPPYGPADGSIYTGNLRSAKATDTYILRGDSSGEEYTPHFTYHGYRYMEVTGYPGKLTQDNITQLHFRTDNAATSTFKSSSKVLNTIQYGAMRGQGSNMMSVPTDCDQRDERLGWMGDASLSGDSMALNYDSGEFMRSFIRSMMDNQDPATGSLPDVVPYQRYGGQPADPSWSQAFPQNVWARYHADNDLTLALRWWDELKAYIANLGQQVAKAGGFANWKPPYGDWVPAGKKTDGEVCSAFSYILATQQMTELATALNRTQDAVRFTNLTQSLLSQYTDAFFHQSSGCFDDCGQTASALSLAIGAVPKGHINSTVAHLLQDIQQSNNNHVTVGIIGAKALFPMLSTHAAHEQAIALAEQTSQPSWGYMFYNTIEPATSSLWELWDSPTQGPGMNSRNHHMFSSISGWLVSYVGGLRRTACGVPMLLAPAFHGLSHTSVSRQTACGLVSLQHRQTGGTHRVSAPRHPTAKTTADLSCGGNGGGVITAVTRADVQQGRDAACVSNAHRQVAMHCLGKDRCSLDLDTLSRVTCNSTDAASHVPHFHATIECSARAVHRINAIIPIGERAEVLVPARLGRVVDASSTVQAATTTITTMDGVDAVRVSLPGGTHTLVLAESK